MSDTAPQPTPAATPPTPSGTAPVNLNDALTSVVNNAPELAASPGLAVGVASSGGDPVVRAQSVARAATATSDNAAATSVNQSSGGLLGHALNWLGNSVTHVVGDVTGAVETAAKDVAKPVANILNKPLQIVQHEYRYLHDVEASHGMLAAISEGLGIAAGAVVGGLATGGAGVGLGAAIAGGLEGQAFYRDSWSRTGSASYVDPHTHQPVSLGRDLASVLGLRPGTEGYKLTSGGIDGLFDLGVNIPGLGILRDIHSVEGAGGALNKVFQGYGIIDGEKVQHAFDEGSALGLTSPFKRAAQDMAGKSAAEIAATPAYNGIPADLLTQLGHARTAEEVKDVFKDVATAHELTFIDHLPTLSRTRGYVSQPLREAAGNLSQTNRVAQNALFGPGRWFHRFSPIATSTDSLGKQSMKELRVGIATQENKLKALEVK